MIEKKLHHRSVSVTDSHVDRKLIPELSIDQAPILPQQLLAVAVGAEPAIGADQQNDYSDNGQIFGKPYLPATGWVETECTKENQIGGKQNSGCGVRSW